MKIKMRQWINVLLGLILGCMGYGCDRPKKYGVLEPNIATEYGVPIAALIYEGQVTNEDEEPLPNMQIVHRGGWDDKSWDDWTDTVYTNSQGAYHQSLQGIFPVNKHKIIVNDTAGVYKSDSIVTTVDFSGGDGEWDKGNGYLKADFKLKKK